MIKKIIIITFLVGVTVLLVYGGINRTLATVDNDSRFKTSEGHGWNSGEFLQPGQTEGYDSGRNVNRGNRGERIDLPGNEISHVIPAIPGQLTPIETKALLYMREEELMARDLYAVLYDQWKIPVFQMICQSEQVHADAIKRLLEKYGLEDPATGSAGVFSNRGLQALYTDLRVKGSQSLADAFKVGAAVEEIDILDLQERLADVNQADIRRVFNNLLNGSCNHLRSFTSVLHTQTGDKYRPEYLSPEIFESIINDGL